MAERIELEQQLGYLEAQKVALFDGGNADQNEVARLNGEIKGVQQQLSAIDTQDIAEIYQTTDKPCIINVSGTDINLQDYVESPDNYRVLAIAIDTKIYELNYAISEQAKRFDIERQQYRDQLTNADAAADAKYNELYEQFHNVKNERDDFERKHQAAASEIDSLKQQLEASVKIETPLPTNLNGNLAEAMRKAHEAKPAIYNVVEINGTKSTAISVETNETIEFHPNYIGKYRIVSHDEAMQMRATIEAEKDNIPDISDPIEVEEPTIEPPTFREEDTTVQEHTVHGEVDADAAPVDGGESFEQRTERRLALLEAQAFGELKIAS